MSSTTAFDDALEAVEHLPVDQQVDLLAIVQRRLAARGRDQIAADVREGQQGQQAGQASPVSVADLMREIES